MTLKPNSGTPPVCICGNAIGETCLIHSTPAPPRSPEAAREQSFDDLLAEKSASNAGGRVFARTKPRDLFWSMNKTEKAFAILLEADRRNGIIDQWFYEGITLKLGNDCRYTPDFLVIAPDGEIALHETKGFMRDDALVKLKTAATIYPFRIILWTLKKGEWTDRAIPPYPTEDTAG